MLVTTIAAVFASGAVAIGPGHDDHDDAHTHAPKIVAPGGGEPVAVPFHPTDLLVSAAETHSGIVFFEGRVAPGSAGAPPHVHSREDEFFYVVSGELTFMNGDEIVTAPPGTFASLTRGHPHAFWNAGEEEAVFLLAASDGNFEDFFDTVAMEMRSAAPADPAAAGALIGRIAAERGIEIRMDLLPPDVAPLYGIAPAE